MINKTLKDQILKSEQGKVLFSYITDIYDNCRIMVEIYEAIGIQFDDIDIMFEDISRQMFPQTATWSLPIWEKRLGLPISDSENTEGRRGKIIAKLQSKMTINPENMQIITKSFTGADIKVIEWIKKFTFKVEADVSDMIVAEEINQIIRKIKPSHMAFLVQFVLFEQVNIYVGACTTVGIIQSLIPYNLEPIELIATAYEGGATTHIVENILLT